MILALAVVIGVVMIAGAILAVHLRNLLVAVVAAGIVSLSASVLYLAMAAPDVAMTEAAIGAGLSTVIFIYALKRTGTKEKDDDD
jgi:energy-converting hydrogenase B subunit D